MGAYNAYISLSGAIDAEVLRDEPLSRRTTYRIGGPADLFVTCHTYAALSRTLATLEREHVEWVILGRGSNILASDEGYRGCVIKLGREFSKISFDGDLVSCGAAATLPKLVSETQARGLSGLECCAGVPGTVGGAISMDAGSRHEWIGRQVRDLVTLRPGEGMHRYGGSEIEWGYRWSSLPTSEIILEATLALKPDDKARIAQDIDRRLARRRRTQPMGKPSCGSVFRNPGDRSVAQMIDSLGLKGYSCGGAQVSEVHANFIVNNGGATAEDVLSVMKRVHDAVEAGYGISLTPEVKTLGFGA